MLYLTKKSKGFTLLEILIALFIFSGVLILTTGIVGQSSGYQTKIRAIGAANQETQRVADMISNDVRTANTEGKITLGIPATITTFRSGVAILSCSAANCTISNESTPSGHITQDTNNTLVVFYKDGNDVKAKIYQSRGEEILYKKVSATSPLTSSILRGLNPSTASAPGDAIAGITTGDPRDIKNDVDIDFGGFAPTNSPSAVSQQAYVTFEITTKTRGTNLPANARTSQSLRSIVTVRNFK